MRKVKSTLKRGLCLLLLLAVLVPLLTGCGPDASLETDLNVISALLGGVSISDSRVYKPIGYDLRTGGDVELTDESVQSINTQTKDARVSLHGVNCGFYTVQANYTGSKLSLDEYSYVSVFQTKSPVVVDNPQGTIESASIWPGGEGTSFATMPDILVLQPGTWCMVGEVRYENNGNVVMIWPENTYVWPYITYVPTNEDQHGTPVIIPFGYEAYTQRHVFRGEPNMTVRATMSPYTNMGFTTYSATEEDRALVSLVGDNLIIAPGLPVGLYTIKITAQINALMYATRDLRLYIVNGYAVTFDTQGGTPTPATQAVVAMSTTNYKYYDRVRVPAEPKKGGYEFLGWYTAASGGEKWDFVKDWPKSDMTLYAQYKKVTSPSNISIEPGSLPETRVGASYSQRLRVEGGSGTYTFEVSSGKLPQGMSLSAQGELSGTSEVPGDYAFSVRAKGNSKTASRTYTLKILPYPIAMETAAAADGAVGVAYTQGFTAKYGTGPYLYRVEEGELPSGLSFSQEGILSGTPTKAGRYQFTILVTDKEGKTASRAYTMAVTQRELDLRPLSLAVGQEAAAYSQAVSAVYGIAPYSFTVARGTLPDGLTLSTEGLLAGTPNKGGSYVFSIMATDNYGATGEREYTLVINERPRPIITTDALPDGVIGDAYATALEAREGIPPYAWQATGLPGWLSLDSATGVITGTPEANALTEAPYTIGIKVIDDDSTVTEKALTLNVKDKIIIDGVSPTTVKKGEAYTGSIAAHTAGGSASPDHYEIVKGKLPDGLTLATDGSIAGTPTKTGSYDFTVKGQKIADTNILPGEETLNITVIALPPVIGNGTGIGTDSITLEAGYAEHKKEYVIDSEIAWTSAMDANNNTAGATIAGGILTIPQGLPEGSYSASFSAQNATGTTQMTVSIDVIAKAPTIDQGTGIDEITLIEGYEAYDKDYTITGAPAPATAMDADNNTAGATISKNKLTIPEGLIPGTYSAHFTAINSKGEARMAATIIVKKGDPVKITTESLPDWTISQGYSQQLAASGGAGGKAYSITAGSLPDGISIAEEGLISGTPTAEGEFSFTVSVTDSAHEATTDSKGYTIKINGALFINPSTENMYGTAGEPFDNKIEAVNGTAPYSYNLSGTLPMGLGFDAATGRITGVPEVVTEGEGAKLEARVTDSVGASANISIRIYIDSPTETAP